MGPEIHPEYLYFTVRRLNKREKHADSSGFPCSVLPQKTIDIRLLYGKGQSIDSF
jgi:hypothetical protein